MVTSKLIALLLAAGAALAQYPSITSPATSSTPPGGSSSALVTYSSTLQTITAGTYFAPFGGGGDISATESDVSNFIPVNASAVNLYVSLSEGPGMGNTFVVTVRANGSDATVTCEIDDTATTCQDNTNLDLLTAADSLSFSIVTTGTISATPNININIGLTDITSPAVHPPISASTHTSAFATSGAYTTSGINTTAAKYLIACVTTSNGTFGAVSDSKGNTWTPLSANIGNFTGNRLFYVLNPIVGTGHTFTVATGGTNSSFEVAAFNGGLQTFDVQSVGFAGMTGGSAQDGSVTPSAGGSLIVSCGSGQQGQNTVSSVNLGFTITDNVTDGSVTPSALGYIIETNIVAKNPTWTLAGSGGFWAVANAVFQ